MAIAKKELEGKIKEAFPNAEFTVTDLVGDADHYELNIKCESFNGLNKVAQHRLVNKALHNCLGTQLHALSIKINN